jgi:predicted negative regulator of RcsB-dependent stress response
MSKWSDYDSVEQWWSLVVDSPNNSRIPLRTLVILVSWEIWCKRNTKIFQNTASTLVSIVAKIKEEARAWVKARASKLQEFDILGDIT